MRRKLIPAASLLALLLAALPARAEDIFGPGNELSNVQGGVPQAPRGAPPPLALVPSAENRSLCDRHFSGMAQANQRKIEEIGRSDLTGAQRSAAYSAYIDERDAFSKRCGATFASVYDARIQQTLAHGRHNFPIEAFPLRPTPEDDACQLPCVDLRGGRPPFRGTPEPIETPPPPAPTTIIISMPPQPDMGPVGGAGQRGVQGLPQGTPQQDQQNAPMVFPADPPPPPPGYKRFVNLNDQQCATWRGTRVIADRGNVYCDVPPDGASGLDGSGVTVEDLTRDAVPLHRLLER